MATARSIAIIGGGIGGLTVANTLARLGMSVSLYERSPYFIPTAGAGFSLQPNGQISLAYIGFKDEIEKILHPYHKWQIINDKGEALSTSHRLGEYKKRFGYYLGSSLRADLVDLLKVPIEKTGHLHYSHKVTNLQQDPDGVTISFENEKEQKSVRAEMLLVLMEYIQHLFNKYFLKKLQQYILKKIFSMVLLIILMSKHRLIQQ
jgi:salicylate hydroxylase